MLHLRADLTRLAAMAGLGYTVTLSDVMTLRRMKQSHVRCLDEWIEDTQEEASRRPGVYQGGAE